MMIRRVYNKKIAKRIAPKIATKKKGGGWVASRGKIKTVCCNHAKKKARKKPTKPARKRAVVKRKKRVVKKGPRKKRARPIRELRCC